MVRCPPLGLKTTLQRSGDTEMMTVATISFRLACIQNPARLLPSVAVSWLSCRSAVYKLHESSECRWPSANRLSSSCLGVGEAKNTICMQHMRKKVPATVCHYLFGMLLIFVTEAYSTIMCTAGCMADGVEQVNLSHCAVSISMVQEF